MPTVQDMESELSHAYLHAVASHAGLAYQPADRITDADGIDATLRATGRFEANTEITQVIFDVQLKATTKIPRARNGRLALRLSAKNYNELRSVRTMSQRLLVALFLPESPDEWVIHSEKQLVLRKCAYWMSLRGAPEIDTATTTVYIPKKNVFSSVQLRSLVERLSTEEMIDYEA